MNNKILLPNRCREGHQGSKNPVFTGFSAFRALFPLNGRGRLGAEVVEDAADAGDLGLHAARNGLEKLPVKTGNARGHGVGGVHSADDDRPELGALAVHDAGGADVGDDREVLPDLRVHAGLCELLAEDGVGLTHGGETVAGDRADAPDAEAGAGERLTPHHAVRQTERLADLTDLVLEEVLHRLNKLKAELFGQTADVVVGLDALVALDDVGVDRALAEEVDALELGGLFFKDVDELLADDLALALGLRNARELIEEAVGRVHVGEIGAQLFAEDLDDLLALALAHETVVHMHAVELIADGTEQQRRHNGAVHAAGQGQKHLAVADLLTDERDLLFDELFDVQRLTEGAPADLFFFAHNLLSLGQNISMAIVMFRTIIIFTVLLLCMRILGKRQLGELELSELVVSVLVADLASLPLQDIGIPLMNGLVSILTLFCLELILSGVTLRSQKLRAALFGKPCFLIEKGTINQKEMHRCRFSVDELTEELRRQSVTDLSTVEYAILETDGTLNVILTPAERPVTAGQLRCAEPETGYPYILISDGTVLRENLRKCGKTEEWLRGECRRQGVKSPEQVFLLTCDTTGNVYFAKREKRP